MLQALNNYPSPIHPSRHPPGTPSPPFNSQPLSKYLTLNFKEDRHTFGRYRSRNRPHNTPDNLFATFYSKEGQKYNRRQMFNPKRTGRETALTERDSIIGTPFSSIEFNQQETLTPVLPSLDRQRYKYLLKAISGLSKNKRMPEFEDHLQKKQVSAASTHSPPSPSQVNAFTNELGSAKIVNLSVDFKEHASNSMKFQCDNPYQKMFKNKRLMQKRYSPTKQDRMDLFHIKILGEEELKVTQVPREPRRQKKQQNN